MLFRSNPVNNSTLFGYSSQHRAIEINTNGAMSFDTSNNSGTLISNFGTSGQILSSQGSSSNPKWGNLTDLSGYTTTVNKNIGGIAYVRDGSGNLDSSSNLVYDGSGIQITSNKNSKLYGLEVQNPSIGTAATTDIKLSNYNISAILELKSSGYTAGTKIDENIYTTIRDIVMTGIGFSGAEKFTSRTPITNVQEDSKTQ